VAQRRRREYLQLLDAAKAAAEMAVDSFNRVRNPYRNESTLILMANAWELLSKAVLVQARISIRRGNRGETIAAEQVVLRLQQRKVLDVGPAETIQQIISLRHAATHHILPAVPDEVMHHLLFYGAKFFRRTVEQQFPTHAKDLPGNFLSISFSDMTTYVDKVQKVVSRARRSPTDRQLVWLLERGIAFDGIAYLTQKQVEAKYRGRKHVMPYLRINGFIRTSDMVRIVPVEAPKSFTADVTLRKGSARDASLPVVVRRTEVETDYPYLTKEVAQRIGRSLHWTSMAMKDLGMKGDTRYHQAIRASSSSSIQRYSEAAVQRLQDQITGNPNYSPF
jgi:Domain of unknown function (DUF3644)